MGLTSCCESRATDGNFKNMKGVGANNYEQFVSEEDKKRFESQVVQHYKFHRKDPGTFGGELEA